MNTSKNNSPMAEKIRYYLDALCTKIPHRHVGSEGNNAAAGFFAEKLGGFGFAVQCPEFDCIDWTHGEVALQAGELSFTAFAGPYSLPYGSAAQLIEASTLEGLKAAEAEGKMLLLHGELAKEQIMPKDFPFYNPDSHREIVALLEAKQPAAIIAATGRNPELAGGWYPFPMFEDGDFDIPNVFMKDVEGERLLDHVGERVSLSFQSRRIPARGFNVIGRKGPENAPRMIFCAHIDTKKDTPGALDNGTGIAALLALAELLTDYDGNMALEILAFNGEDYYNAVGQQEYLKANQGTLDNIHLVVNMDGAGYKDGDNVFQLFECPDPMAAKLRGLMDNHSSFKETEPTFYQGDHMIFVQAGRPAVAITSENYTYLSTEITHTAKDKPELVDCNKVAAIASALRDISLKLEPGFSGLKDYQD